jgi:outer membrane protein assembly factor BamB
MRTFRIVALIVVFLCVGLAASAGPVAAVVGASPGAAIDWPQFRFDDRHDGVNTQETVLGAKNVRFLDQTWRAQLGELVDFSSPVVADGVVYIGSSDGRLWAYPADGCGDALCTVPLWQSTSLAQILDTPTVAGGFVYVGSQTSLDSNDGKLDVFSAGGCGKAVCKPLWQGLAGADSVLMSSPAVAGGVVYVGTFGRRLFAFDAGGCGAKRCTPLWAGVTGGSIESTPTVGDGVVYVGSDDGRLNAFDADGCGKATCKPSWTGDMGGDASPVFESSPALANGMVYLGSQHDLAAFDAGGCGAKTCDPVWQAPNPGEFYGGSPAVTKTRVYIGLETGIAVFDAKGCGHPVCDALWTGFGSGAQAAVLSSPTVANGVVYAGRNTAEVLAWKAKGCGSSFCSEIWKGFTNDQIVTSSPTVVNGKLYIGSADNASPEDSQGRIYVWELPPGIGGLP